LLDHVWDRNEEELKVYFFVRLKFVVVALATEVCSSRFSD